MRSSSWPALHMSDPDNTIVDRNRLERINPRAISVCAANHNQSYPESLKETDAARRDAEAARAEQQQLSNPPFSKSSPTGPPLRNQSSPAFRRTGRGDSYRQSRRYSGSSAGEARVRLAD